MSKRPAIEAIDASASATIAPATGQGDPGLAPAPGDGGTPALERQDTGWANASSDKKGAAKRLVGRLKRKVANSDLVRKLKSGGDGGVDSNSESEPGDATSDDGSEYYSDPEHEDVQLPRLHLQKQQAQPPSPAAAAATATAGTQSAGGRTVALQVIMARGLPGSDLNGLSDPYCEVRCSEEGGTTAVAYNCLTPRWNETFVFSAHATAREADIARLVVHLTVKDRNKHLSDDSLGEASVSLASFSGGASPQWLDLQRPSKGTAPAGGCGQLCVSMWLGPRIAPHETVGQGDPQPIVSTLCAPRGSCRMLPCVVHSHGHTLYEEPAHVYLDIGLDKMVVKDATALQSAPKQEVNSRSRRNRSEEAGKQLEGRPDVEDLQPRGDESSADSQDRPASPEEAHRTFAPEADLGPDDQSIAPESGEEDASDGDSRGMSLGLSFGDPFQDDDKGGGKGHGRRHSREHSNRQGGSSVRDSKDGHAEPDETWLFLKVVVSGQAKKTKLLLLQGDSIRWRDHFIFPVTTPLRRQLLTLLLYRAVADKSRGRLVGSALIPLIDLMDRRADLGAPGVAASEGSMQGLRWFQLQRWGRDGEPLGALRLSFAACDADARRQLYRQPLVDLQEATTQGAKDSTLVSAVDGAAAAEQLREERRQQSPSQQLPSIADEPLGVFKMTLSHVDLAETAHSFAVITCGPHWGLTSIVPDSDRPCFNWQVQIPVHDPFTLFQLGVFKSGKSGKIAAIPRHIPFVKDKPLLLGKLRVRLSTMVPGRPFTVQLPMLAGRRNGGERTCTAHLTLQVDYRSRASQLRAYTRTELPPPAYYCAIANGANDKETNDQQRKMVYEWLEAQQPSLPEDVTAVMADNARDEFSLPRAHINFRRCQEALNGLKRFGALIERTKSWTNPVLSITMHGLAWLACYRTTIFALLMVGGALYHTLRRANPEKEAPLPMDDDPTGLKAEGGSAEDERAGGLSMKIKAKAKYDHLVSVGLRLQNGFEDFAGLFERIQAAFSWKDPTASAVCTAGLVALGAAYATLGFSTTTFIIACVVLRHPVLRSPTTPLPMRFYQRLPTRSDEIM